MEVVEGVLGEIVVWFGLIDKGFAVTRWGVVVCTLAGFLVNN